MLAEPSAEGEHDGQQGVRQRSAVSAIWVPVPRLEVGLFEDRQPEVDHLEIRFDEVLRNARVSEHPHHEDPNCNSLR